jgi:hypothetical protein
VATIKRDRKYRKCKRVEVIYEARINTGRAVIGRSVSAAT